MRFMGVEVLQVAEPRSWKMLLQKRCKYDVVLVAGEKAYQRSRAALAACKGVPVVYATQGLDALLQTGVETKSISDGAWAFAPMNLNQTAGASPALPDATVDLVQASHVTLVASGDEAAALRSHLPHVNVTVGGQYLLPGLQFCLAVCHGDQSTQRSVLCRQVIPTIQEVVHKDSLCSGRHGLLFIAAGGGSGPDTDAALVLLRDVLPLLLARKGSASAELAVHIVGLKSVPESVARLVEANDQHVTVHESMSADLLLLLLQRVQAVILPYLSGADLNMRWAPLGHVLERQM